MIEFVVISLTLQVLTLSVLVVLHKNQGVIIEKVDFLELKAKQDSFNSRIDGE